MPQGTSCGAACRASGSLAPASVAAAREAASSTLRGTTGTSCSTVTVFGSGSLGPGIRLRSSAISRKPAKASR